MTRRGTRRTLLSPITGLPVTKAIEAVSGLIAYWPHQETTGTDLIGYDASGLAPTLDGTIVSTTIGQPATPELGLCHSFDAINDYNQLPAVALDAVLNRNTGTLIYFTKAPGSDGNNQSFVIIGDSAGNDFINMTKEPAGDNYRLRVKTAGNFVGTLASMTVDTWIMHTITWNFSNPNTDWIFYENNTSLATPSTAGILTNALANNNTVIGALSNAPAWPIDALMCHFVIYDNVISDADSLSIAQGGGVV